jgi:hypothetical protein
MASIQKTENGWIAIGTTVEELMLGAEAIERITSKPPRSNQKTPAGGGNKTPAGNATTAGKTRVQELREFLIKEGPMLRRDVIAKSGIPQGTVNTTLNDKNFRKLPDGKWSGEEAKK